MIKRYLVSFAGYFFIYASNIISIPLIINLSSESNYGEYVLLISYLGILVALSPLGLGFKSKREMPSSTSLDERSNIFYPQFYANILSVIILGYFFNAFFYFFSSSLFDEPIELDAPLLVIYGVLFVIYTQIGHIFKFYEKIVSYNLLGILNPLFFLILVILTYHFKKELNLEALIYAQIFSLCMNILIFSYSAYRIVGFKLVFYKKLDFLWDIRVGFPLLLVVLIEIIISSSDRFIIGYYLESNKVSYYTVAYSIASLMLVVPKLFSISLEPRLMKLVDNESFTEASSLVSYSYNLFFLIAIPLMAGAFMYGELVLTLFLNADFAKESYVSLRILILGMLFYGQSIFMFCILSALIKTKKLLFLNSITAFVNLILNLLIFYVYQDILVAAITSLVSYLLLFLMTRFYVLGIFKLKIYTKEFFKVVLAVSITSICLLNLNFEFNENDILEFSINFFLFIFIYLISLVLFRSFIVKTIYNWIFK